MNERQPTEVEKTKRRVWQFHLSTAVLFALASGLLLYLNMNPRSEYVLCYLANDDKLKQNLMYGFPSTIDWQQQTICSPSNAEIAQIKSSHTFTLPSGVSVHVRETEWYWLDQRYSLLNIVSGIIDAGFAAVTLAGLAYLIRRREARKT